MTSTSPTLVTGSPVSVSGLTAGESYIAQNIGRAIIEYCVYATDPSAVDLAWNRCRRYEWITIDNYDTATPVWVRTLDRSDQGRLSVIPAP